MANFQTDSNQIDRLSNLPDALLVTIISFLPTHIAVRTSVLCHRFRHLWEASPSLALISRHLPHPQSENFVVMAKCVLLRRNPSHPLVSLHLEVSGCYEIDSFLSSLLVKARSLDLRHLTIDGCWFLDFLPILSTIFTINSLRCLSLGSLPGPPDFPSGITLTCMRSLSLRFFRIDPTKLNRLLSQLCSLEDLHLGIYGTPWLSLSSKTIRKLKLIIPASTRKLENLGLSLPSLESLHLEIRDSLQSSSHIHGEVPLLRKAVINLHQLHDVSVVAELLNCISHVEELSLYLKESEDVKDPIPILLESEKDMSKFSNLKHLDVTLCFYEHNFEAVTMMLHNCHVLQLLKLVHEVVEENYANPKTCFFHVFFKGAAMAFYILSALFVNNFVIIFVVTVFLSALDFWVVKNVSGRILVGLRWWNEINDLGECLEIRIP